METSENKTTESNIYGNYATYSPEDDKIRLYFMSRIPKDDWDKFISAGFVWTMKQESDLSAVWTTTREDMAREYCGGELLDEVSSFAERSADRAERFGGYLENRLNDVSKGIDNVQVIGMQSQEKAEKIANRIERIRDKADLNFSKAKYWNSRIDSVIRHAVFKESPGLRQRRIRTLKTECARHQKDQDYLLNKINKYQAMNDQDFSKVEWKDESKKCSRLELIERLQKIFNTGHAARWLEHLQFRINFEQKVLEIQGITKLQADFKKFGTINGKYEIVRVNKSKGIVNSLTVKNPLFNSSDRWQLPEIIILIENVSSYNPPDETIKREKKAVCPILNLSKEKIIEIFGSDCEIKEMTSEEYKNRNFEIVPVKNGKMISKYSEKRAEEKGDFKVRGHIAFLHRKNIFVILTDKKFDDERVQEFLKVSENVK